MEEYALYQGDKLLCIGTVEEIAKKMNIKRETVLYYKTPSYIKRHKGKGKRLVLVSEERTAIREKRKDCFGYSERLGGCSVTTYSDCADCVFYKTKEQHIEDNKRANERLRNIRLKYGVKI